MSTQIQTQANKVWQSVTDPATGATYRQTATVTWAILKETGYLLWLVVCLVLVFGEWIWKTGYRTGWNFRSWVNGLSSAEKPSADQLFSETGKSILEVGKSTAAAAIAAAKDQLGIENKPEPPLVVSSPPAPAPKPAPPQPPKPNEVAPVATPEPPATVVDQDVE